MTTRNRRRTSQQRTKSVTRTHADGQPRTTASQRAPLPDATGALPLPEDGQAAEFMYALETSRARLFYPSTVRTTLVRGLRASWHWVWVFKYSTRPEDDDTRAQRWLRSLKEILDGKSVYAGLIELAPEEINFYVFLSCLREADPLELQVEFLPLSWSFDLKFQVHDYSAKRGPAYYLRDIRYPCCRVGVTIVDDDPSPLTGPTPEGQAKQTGSTAMPVPLRASPTHTTATPTAPDLAFEAQERAETDQETSGIPGEVEE